MVLLDLLVVGLIIFLAYGLYTQVLLPAFDPGKKARLFPAFRKSKIHDEVVKVHDEVEDLKLHTKDLSELAQLQQKKRDLEAQIANITNQPKDKP